MPKDTFQSLSSLGLSKYETKVYLTLISEGVSTAKNISDITGIPYGKVYEIMMSLSNKGFSMVLPSKPMKYKAVSPKQAITSAKKDMEDKFNKIEKDITEHLGPFAENKKFTQPKSIFSVINGRSNVVKKTDELIQKAEHNIHIQCSANSLSRLILHKESLKKASEKGVKIHVAGAKNNENKNEIRSLKAHLPRSIKSSRNNFISIDGKECMVIDPSPDDDNIIYGKDLGIYALSPSFTRFIDNFFISEFGRAKEINFE